MNTLSEIWNFLAGALEPFFAHYGDLLFGLISGIIAAGLQPLVKSFFEKRRFRTSVLAELSEIRFRTLSIILALSPKMNLLNRAKLEWVKKQSMAFLAGEEREVFCRYLDSLLALSDVDLAQCLAKEIKANKTKAIPKIETPFLASNAKQISLLGSSEQVALIKILSRIQSANGKIDDMVHWDRTSMTVNADNYSVVLENSRESMKATLSASEQLWKAMDQYSQTQ